MDEHDVVPVPQSPATQVHTVAARAPLREQLAADVEAFLRRGGSIEPVPLNQRADLPRAPDSNYGREAI